MAMREGWVGQRRRRDRLLGVAAMTISGSQVLAVIGSVVLLADLIKNLVPRAVVIAQSLDVAGDVLRVAGFAVAGAALLGCPPNRAGRLRTGLILVAGGYGAWCVSDVDRAIKYARIHAGRTYIASHGALGISDLFIAVAAAVAAVAFVSALHADDAGARAQRDNRLGWSSVFLAAGILFAMISSILFFLAISRMGATSEFTAGFGIAAAGAAVGIGGPVLAAVAFLSSARRQQSARAGRLRDRDGLLAAAAAALAVGLAISAVGAVETTSAASLNGFDGPSLTAAWLDAIRQLGWAVGIGIASAAFLLSRRTELQGALSPPEAHVRGEGNRRRAVYLWVLLLAVVCGVTAVALLQTGGGGRSPSQASSGAPTTKPSVSAELSSSGFRAAADSICKSGNIQAITTSSGISHKADLASAAALGEVISILQEGESKLEALSGPRTLEAARDALVAALEQEISTAQSASTAARAGDQASFDSALDRVATETREAQADGSMLGAPDCATGS